MAWSRLKQDEVAVRRTALLKLRREGVRYDDERVEALGYSSPDAARKDLHRALEAHRDAEAAEVSIYRQQENERLDALLEAAWPRATQPSPVFDKEGNVISEEIDVRAIDTVLRLMDRRAKLNGIDMPAKAEVTGAGGGPLQMSQATTAELEALIGLGPATTASPEEPSDSTSGDQADSATE
ncbi:hypothetical protein AB0F30_16930 [Streptomyces sp. NPDC029006]|uniref:hypothetical protein n=1 Tax=Streptomyces sp. NPDC029006 TaxID=3155467 RepID=UPI0033FD5D03